MAERESERAGTEALSHVARTPGGFESRMVDVGAKQVTEREAVARALVRFPKAGVTVRILAQGRSLGGSRAACNESRATPFRPP